MELELDVPVALKYNTPHWNPPRIQSNIWSPETFTCRSLNIASFALPTALSCANFDLN